MNQNNRRLKEIQQEKQFFKQLLDKSETISDSLAYQGKIQEAIQAYEQALKENPNDEDAKFNKDYLEKQLPPPEENQKQNEQQQEKQDRNQFLSDPLSS